MNAPKTLATAPLGKTIVLAYCLTDDGTRWVCGRLIGRTREQTPRFDVMLPDRTVLTGLPQERVKVVAL